ncbi:hypothetical protein Enr13x_66370 [Stieleria neptunia]|uniref:Uncharacterized protein n=1 Tax=Stieleria neptunia TaxID=2527979 RepID=A0A518I0Y8_9BACT|nr:hypothetical protein Enr13x_66370 [Stieleria neptunia]
MNDVATERIRNASIKSAMTTLGSTRVANATADHPVKSNSVPIVVRIRIRHTSQAERRWSPRRRDRPDLKNKLNSPTAVHHLVHASGHDDSPSHRRSLSMYSIGIAVGNPVSQSAVGTSGVGLSWIVLVLSIAVLVLVLNRQASVCLRRPSRPRTYRTVTSNAKPRKRRFDDIRWATFESRSNDSKSIATKEREKTQKKKWPLSSGVGYQRER